MSRTSMTTGNILFNTSDAKTSATAKIDGAPMHIAFIADFSGRASRGAGDVQGLSQRRAIEIDRDNFDDVFAKFKVRLGLPFNDEDIAFNDIDELHPDHLVEHVTLFERFRVLKRKLKKPEHFQAAVAEIQSWAPPPETSAQTDVDTPSIAVSANILDTVLDKSSEVSRSPQTNIDQLIRGIVAPYLEKKADPLLPEMQAHVDNAMAETLRKIMHSSEFQTLEANWRAVYFLIRRLETDNKLKLFLIDASREEISEDLNSHSDITETQTYALLVEKYRVQGATPFSLFQFNFELADQSEDIKLASAMALIAQANKGVALAGAHEKLAGCADLAEFEKTQEWDHGESVALNELWQTLRQQVCSKHLALVAPRFLLRLPYGKKTSPIDSFAFEELANNIDHRYYLWGNSASLVTLLIAMSFKQDGWEFKAGSINEVDDLPLHIYQDEQGDQVAKACGEIFITDTTVSKFADAGILSVRSVKGNASVLIPNFRSFDESGSTLFT